MKLRAHSNGIYLSMACLAVLHVACERRGIEVYTIGKETPVEEAGAFAGVAIRLPEPASESWDPVDTGGGPRVASFRVVAADPEGEAADMGVTVFAGAAGGILANVNRWRGEMQQPQVTQDQLTNVLRVDGHDIHVVDAANAERRTLGAILPLAEETWFFKLTGPKAVVTEQREQFFDYINGLGIHGTSAPVAPTIDAMPDRPKITYDVPGGWVEGESTMMRVASFTVTEDDREAEIAIIPLGKSGAAQLAIINQWRSTVGLDATTEDRLPEMIENVEIGGREYEMVNFESEGADPDKVRIIVAYATVGEHTWFFKVFGESNLVAAQHAPLTGFLESVEFVSP